MIDIIEEFKRIQSMSNAETFDRTTDSLEALAAALGIGPCVGLTMFGIVDATQVASAITVITNNLQNVPSNLLEGQFFMQVLYNASVPGAAPEGETRQITNFVQGGALQTFTADAFSANIEAGDFVAIFHQSLLPIEILARGTLDTSSATVPEDSTRTEVADYFKGSMLMATEGAVRFQPRRIVTSSAAGVFTLDPSNPFTAVPGLVDYIIIGGQTEFIPGADAVVNRTPADVIGGKADTAVYAADAVSSIVRLIKGLMGAKILYTGAADAGSNAVTCVDAAVFTEVDQYYRGLTLVMITGDNTGLSRPITSSDQGATSVEIDPDHPFPNAIAATDVYVVVSDYHEIAPVADATNNLMPSHIIGNKTSTPVYVPDATSDMVRYLKGILNTINGLHEPTEGLVETWQDPASPDLNLWTPTDPATGAAWLRTVSGAFLYLQTTPNANETARLASTMPWQLHSITPNLNLVVKKTILEFEMVLGVPANVDNAAFFVGFTTAVGDTRASNNIIGFGLTGDALQSVTDDGGAETVATGFGETLTNHNKLRIEVYEGNVDFYVNEVLVANSQTNIPNIPSFLNFYIDTEAGGACAFPIGMIKVKYEMVERY